MEEAISLAKARRIGGSLVVTLPIEIVKDQGIEEGEIIEIKIKKRRKDYFGALKDIGKFTKEDKARGQLD